MSFQELIWNKEYKKRIQGRMPLHVCKIIDIMHQCLHENSTKRRLRILDIGCGDGTLLSNFTKDFDCYGVDVSREALKIAKGRGIAVKKIDLEKENLPFNKEFFDLVVMSEVLEHVTNTDNVLQKIRYVLHKKGRFILNVPNVNTPISWMMMALLDFPPLYSSRYHSTHIRDFTLKTVKKALYYNGFKIEKVTGTYIYPFNNILSRQITKLIPRFSEMIIILSTKENLIRKLPWEGWFDIRKL